MVSKMEKRENGKKETEKMVCFEHVAAGLNVNKRMFVKTQMGVPLNPKTSYARKFQVGEN